MLLLVHKTLDGEPIGVWNDEGGSYYAPGKEDQQAGGQATLDQRGYAVPWSVFVNRKANAVTYEDWWEALDTDRTLQEALDSRREVFFSRAAARTTRDR